MHRDRRKRINAELKTSTALSLSVVVVMGSNSPINNRLSISKMPSLLFKSEGKYVLKCLPLNMIGIGDTKEKAFELFSIDLVETILDSFDKTPVPQIIAELLRNNAASIYWEKYQTLAEKSKKQAKASLQSKTVVRTGIDDIEVITEVDIDPAFIDIYKDISASHGLAN